MALDSAELSQARADLEDLLADEASIERATKTPKEGGGRDVSWAELASVPCNIAPLAGGEVATMGQSGNSGTAGDRIDDRTTHVLTVPFETDITEADRVVVSGATYEVTLVRKRGSWELVRRVELKEEF